MAALMQAFEKPYNYYSLEVHKEKGFEGSFGASPKYLWKSELAETMIIGPKTLKEK
jgi:hypothetical protein